MTSTQQTFTDRIAFALARAVTAKPWLTVLLSVLFVVPFAVGLRSLTFSTDYRVFFADGDPQLQRFNALENEFTRTDNVVFVIRPKSGTVFEPEVLGVVQKLVAAAPSIPFSRRIDALTTYQHSRIENDEMVVSDLVPGDATMLTPDQLRSIRTVATGSPLLVGSILARDERATGVNVILHLPRKGPLEVTQAVEASRALAEKIAAAHPGIEVRVSGMALFNDAFREASMRDMTMLIPLMTLVMISVMAWFLRSLLSTLVITLIVGLASLCAMGFAGWAGYPLTPPSAAAPIVILTLAVAEGIHIVTAVRRALIEAAKHHGEAKPGFASRRDAVIHAVSECFRAVLLTSVTTIVGFLCLNYSDSPPYGHLANVASIGIGSALLLSITLLPALLTLVPLSPIDDEKTFQWAPRLASWVLRSHHAVLVGTVVVVAVGGIAITRMSSDEHFLDYFDRTTRFRTDTEFMHSHLTGIYPLEFPVAAGAPDRVTNPEYLRALDEFAVWLRTQKGVRHVYSFSDVMRAVVKGIDPDPSLLENGLPTTRDLASQSLLLYEMSLPKHQSLTDRLNSDRSVSRLSVLVGDLSSGEIRALSENAEAWLKTNAGLTTHGTSPVVVFSYMSQRNSESMTTGNLVDLIVMSLIMMLAFRSFRLGVLSMIPNVLPIIVAYGVWALVMGTTNIIVSVTGTICLGIVVDDTIHFMTRYRYARTNLGLSMEDAIHDVYRSTGTALSAATTVLVLGFGVLTLSSFQMNREFGMLAVMMIGIALPGDLLVLPALLKMWGEPKSRPALAHRTTTLDSNEIEIDPAE